MQTAELLSNANEPCTKLIKRNAGITQEHENFSVLRSLYCNTVNLIYTANIAQTRSA